MTVLVLLLTVAYVAAVAAVYLTLDLVRRAAPRVRRTSASTRGPK